VCARAGMRVRKHVRAFAQARVCVKENEGMGERERTGKDKSQRESRERKRQKERGKYIEREKERAHTDIDTCNLVYCTSKLSTFLSSTVTATDPKFTKNMDRPASPARNTFCPLFKFPVLLIRMKMSSKCPHLFPSSSLFCS